jgi:hypothetical protein
MAHCTKTGTNKKYNLIKAKFYMIIFWYIIVNIYKIQGNKIYHSTQCDHLGHSGMQNHKEAIMEILYNA